MDTKRVSSTWFLSLLCAVWILEAVRSSVPKRVVVLAAKTDRGQGVWVAVRRNSKHQRGQTEAGKALDDRKGQPNHLRCVRRAMQSFPTCIAARSMTLCGPCAIFAVTGGAREGWMC